MKPHHYIIKSDLRKDGVVFDIEQVLEPVYEYNDPILETIRLSLKTCNEIINNQMARRNRGICVDEIQPKPTIGERLDRIEKFLENYPTFKPI
jgi:hypothetical protein